MSNLRVNLPSHIIAKLLEQVDAQLAPLNIDNGVRVAVEHLDGGLSVGVGGRHHPREALREEQPRRHADDASELVLAGQTRKDGHGAALGEAAQDDALRRDAGVDLLLDQVVEVLLASLDTLCVLAADEGVDIAAKLLLQSVRSLSLK